MTHAETDDRLLAWVRRNPGGLIGAAMDDVADPVGIAHRDIQVEKPAREQVRRRAEALARAGKLRIGRTYAPGRTYPLCIRLYPS